MRLAVSISLYRIGKIFPVYLKFDGAQVKNIEKKYYVDPYSKAYYEDRLFDRDNRVLNRDDSLAPFIRLRAVFEQQGGSVHTADYLPQQESQEQVFDYYSLGVLDSYDKLRVRNDVRLRGFVIFEPPVVDPRLYSALPELTAAFERVYIHNVDGDGYSLEGVDRPKLRKLFWPQPHKDVLIEFWKREERMRRVVMINGNHKPASYNGELYSKRIDALAVLSKFGAVDLYGRGWKKWWSRSSMWLPYWQHRGTLMSIYKGECESKYAVLSQYAFALCFENMAMKGYITEKIFDCLYSGTIPLYLGAKDVSDLIPDDVYIDCRKFASWEEIHEKIMGMREAEIRSMRAAGREFVQGAQGLKYYNSLIEIFHE